MSQDNIAGQDVRPSFGPTILPARYAGPSFLFVQSVEALEVLAAALDLAANGMPEPVQADPALPPLVEMLAEAFRLVDALNAQAGVLLANHVARTGTPPRLSPSAACIRCRSVPCRCEGAEWIGRPHGPQSEAERRARCGCWATYAARGFTPCGKCGAGSPDGDRAFLGEVIYRAPAEGTALSGPLPSPRPVCDSTGCASGCADDCKAGAE